ncbi:MAG TPA: ROK family protein, partial [Bacilli bacterium]|nr:ROK family protein [Bacilli bacterium]
MRFAPKYDPGFRPAILELRKFKDLVNESNNKSLLYICIERNDGYNYHLKMDIFQDNTGYDDYNYQIVERLVKTILWVAGGYKIYVAGSNEIYRRLKEEYQKNGKREFDALFMQRVYGFPFEVIKVTYDEIPPLKEEEIKIVNDLKGCRIGFDAGGSDRKVSAVVDGEVIFSTETVWHPKLQSDPQYHYDGIVESFKLAASKMPRVDAVGISSAGIYINNEVRVASLFIKVPDDVFAREVKNIYIRAVKDTFGDIPFRVVNDGEVTALAGANQLNANEVLGIAMGTSEAVGYVNKNHNLTG